MSKNNLFKLLFVAMFAFAATAFTACSDDNDELTTAPVLEATPSTLTFTGEGGTQTIAITANCGWTVDTSSLEGWADVTPLSGSGNGTLTVTTYEATVSHTGVISFMLQHEYYGNWGKAESTVTVKQNAGDVPVTPAGDALYEENCGNSVSKGEDGYWPYVTAYEGWQRGGTLDQSGVTYGGTSSSVRNSGTAYDDSTVSGAPYISVKTLEVSNINIASNTNFTLQFVAQNTESTLSTSPFTPTFGDINASSFKLEVAVNGTWYTVPFATSPLGGSASWYTCVAPFKLAADMATSTLAIRVSGFTGGSNLRLDDLKLFEGGEGAELGGGETPGPGDGYTFTKVSTVTSGKQYLFVADGKKAKYISANYGYLQVDAVSDIDGKITVSSLEDAFTLTEADGGYTIMQSDNRYLIQTGNFDSFNVDAAPTEGQIFSIVPQTDGSFKILNTNVNKYMQFDAQYSSFGSYTDARGTMPFLYELGEGGGENPGPGPEPTGGVTFDLSKQGFENAESQDGKSITEGGYTLTFAKAAGGTNPSWYNNGSSFRLYASNTLTVSGGTLKTIELVFADSDKSNGNDNEITTDKPTYTEPKWEGDAASVVFTIAGTKSTGTQGGHRRIVKVIINGGEGSGEQPAEPKVTTAAYQNLTAESVTLGGSFEGFTTAPAEVGVEYLILTTGTAALANWDTATKVKAASVASPFTVAVTGLTAETQYAYRAYAGDVYGEPMTFVTPAAGSSETWETVADALAAGNHSVKATVVGINNVSVMLADNTGKILVYLGKTPSVAVGDVVTAVGDVELRYGLYQFKNTTALTTVESGAYTQPAPVEYDGAKLDAFYGAPAYDYVTFKGTLVCEASGSYTNYYVTVAGTSTVAAAQIYRPLAAMESELKAMDGKTVTVTGYMCGTTLISASQTKYSNVMALSVVADGEQGGGDEPDPTGKSVALTAADIAKIGSSYADFSLTAADGSAWSGYGMLSTDFLQLGWNTNVAKNASKCYVLTPEVNGNITTITITPDNAGKTFNDRVFAALPVDFEYTGQTADEVKAAAYAYSANTVQNSTEPLTIDLKGKSLNQVVIRAVGGACYVADIKVEFE